MAVVESSAERGRFDETTTAGRAVRYGSNSLVMTLAFVGILILINVIAARVGKRWDLTAERQFSLAPQTHTILAGLEAPVQVTAFFQEGNPSQTTTEDLLKEYALASGGKLTYEFVDPERQPGLARQLGVTSYGSIVFQQGERKQTVFAPDEQGLTSAVLKVTTTEQKTIYFLTGHGEPGPEDFAGPGFSSWRDALQRDNYQIATLNLAVSDTVPSNAAVVVVAATERPLGTDEVTRLQGWLDGGGAALVLAGLQTDASIQALLDPWQVTLGQGVVVDPAASFPGDPATPIIVSYPQHDITRDLGGLTTFFPVARPIQSDASTAQPLLTTSPQSWAETNLQNQQVQFDPGQDGEGPVTIGMAVERGSDVPPAAEAEAEVPATKKPRLVVFGNSAFISNEVLSAIPGGGNLDLAINAVNWLATDESLISIRTSPQTPREVVLTGPQSQAIFYGATFGLPLLVLLVGGWVWWGRR